MSESILNLRLYTCLHDLQEVYWIYARADKTKTNTAFSEVKSKVYMFFSFRVKASKLVGFDSAGALFPMLKILSEVDVKSISRTSPKMTAEQKARTVEFADEFQRELKSETTQTVERIFEVLRPKKGFDHASDEQLRLAISKGLEEVERLAMARS
jgi:hypothetical protein